MKKLGIILPARQNMSLSLILFILSSYLLYTWLVRNTTVCLSLDCPTIEEAAKLTFISFVPLLLILCYLGSALILWAINKFNKQ
jgi:hypothetical protein